MSIGIGEFDKVSHTPLGTLCRRAVAPMDAFGCELGLPVGKLLLAADVETEIAESRLASSRGRDARRRRLDAS